MRPPFSVLAARERDYPRSAPWSPGLITMNFKLTAFASALGVSASLLLTGTQTLANDTPPAPAEETAVSRLPPQELTGETLFLLLLGEIAGARGEIGVSMDAYIEIARQTRDPRIAQRATEIALFARDIDTAAEAARLWVDTDPASDQARRVLASVLATGGERLNEVQLHLARILAENPDDLEQNLLGLNRALSRLPDKTVVRSIVQRLTEPYMTQPAAHFARAQAAVGTEDGLGALIAIDKALELRPDWEIAVMFKAQLLVQLDSGGQAVDLLADYLERHPDDQQARLTYARTLVSVSAFEEARDEFAHLLDRSPGDIDLLYALALVSSQIGEYVTAAHLFERALNAGHPEANHIRLSLGRIAEEQERLDKARYWYGEVTPSHQYLDAQIRISVLLAQQGLLEQAREHLHAIAPESDIEARRLLLAETMLLREASRYRDAFDLVESALRDDPESADLLYESAMLAERLDRIQLMETRLRTLIALDPDHAHAYNALGYTFADRNIRLDEAEELIVRALELSPDDPFILDSMGWILYRKHDHAGALEHLERAYSIRPDPEIAAHLGEVLWSLERHDDALRIWTEALAEHPDNDTLNETVQRLRPRQ